MSAVYFPLSTYLPSLYVSIKTNCLMHYHFLPKAIAGTDASEHQLFIAQHAVSKVKETISRLASEHRELHSSVSKVGKTIDRVRIL